jgi:hypothetical protein
VKYIPLEKTIRTICWLACPVILAGCGGAPCPPELPPRLRGVTIEAESATVEQINRIADWGANFVFFNFSPPRKGEVLPPTGDNPLRPYEKTLAALRQVLPTLRERGLKAAVGLSPWGRRLDYLWKDVDAGEATRGHMPKFWEAFAREFKDEPSIVAYEILGEPNYPDGQDALWYADMLPRNIKAIRSVNPSIWLIVEPGPYGLPGGFKKMPLVEDPYVIYSFHPYCPHGYLHQGIFEQKTKDGSTAYAKGQEYPGMLQMFDGNPRILWDKQQLKEFMQPAVEFAQKHHVRMLAGEFGVVRWAPGREKWMADMIDSLEELGFDWSCYSLNGWNGWNFTFGPDAKPSLEAYGGEETGVLKEVRRGWSLNRAEPKGEGKP